MSHLSKVQRAKAIKTNQWECPLCGRVFFPPMTSPTVVSEHLTVKSFTIDYSCSLCHGRWRRIYRLSDVRGRE